MFGIPFEKINKFVCVRTTNKRHGMKHKHKQKRKTLGNVNLERHN